MTEDTKQVQRIVRTVYSTEEFSDLQSAVSQAGGYIVGTTSLRNGGGISVTIEVDPERKQF